MKADQRLKISQRLIAFAIKCGKEVFDALCMLVFLRTIFGCGVMKKTSLRSLAALLGMNRTRIKILLDKCISLGFIVETENNYRLMPLREKGTKEMCVPVPLSWDKRGRDEREIKTTYKKVQDAMRKIALFNYIQSRTYLLNAITDRRQPKSLKDYKKATKILKRMGYDPRMFDEENFSELMYRASRGIPMSTLAKKALCCEPKALRLLREMIKDGWIYKTPNIATYSGRETEAVECICDGRKLEEINRHNPVGWVHLRTIKRYDKNGHPLWIPSLRVRCANIYRLTEDRPCERLRKKVSFYNPSRSKKDEKLHRALKRKVAEARSQRAAKEQTAKVEEHKSEGKKRVFEPAEGAVYQKRYMR